MISHDNNSLRPTPWSEWEEALEALRALSEPRHACVGCGGCCHGVRVRLLGADEHTRVRTLSSALNVLDPIENGAMRQVDGRCVMLDERQRCSLHSHFGAAAKPLLCQQYPLVLLDTESEQRIGVDPGCFTSFSHWRDAELSPANARLAPSVSVLDPEQASEERELLRWARREDATVASTIRFLLGLELSDAPVPSLSRRWLTRLSGLPLEAVLRRPEMGAPVRDTLLPVFAALRGLDLDALPALPAPGSEEDAFAMELTRRTLFLRVVTTLPVTRVVALLCLLGAESVGQTGLRGRAFGRAIVAWNRAIRVPAFWTTILPNQDVLAALLEEPGLCAELAQAPARPSVSVI